MTFISLGGAAAAQDWSGSYVGAQTTNISFANTYYWGDGTQNGSPFDGGGSMTGLFAGYNHQTGSFVIGGEISYLSGNAALDQFPTYFFSDMIDLKARAGYSLGRVLPYAVVGWSRAEWTNGPLPPVTADGVAYGIGAEMHVTDRLLVGLEYLQRDLVADDFVGGTGQYMEGDLSAVTARIGYAF